MTRYFCVTIAIPSLKEFVRAHIRKRHVRVAECSVDSSEVDNRLTQVNPLQRVWIFRVSFFRNILIFRKSEFDTLEEVCKVIFTCYGSLNKTACLIFYKNVGDNHVNLTGQTGHSKSNLLNLAHHPITQRSSWSVTSKWGWIKPPLLEKAHIFAMSKGMSIKTASVAQI